MAAPDLVTRHLRFGWAALLVFLTLGIALEALHGLKIGWYLDLQNGTRRLMWTLGHAHGTLLALVNVGFAWTVSVHPWKAAPQASMWLIGASVAMPLGFLAGGLLTYGGDPGLGVALVALGGLMLFVAVLLTCFGLRSTAPTDRGAAGAGKQRKR